MCELANSKFGGELSNNNYSNIIGVHTSVYKPSAAPVAAPAPAPIPAPPSTPSNDKHDKYPYPADIIYPYPYVDPYLYPPVIPIQMEERVRVVEKTSEKSPETKEGKPMIQKELTFFQKPIGKVAGLAVLVLAVYSGYKYFKK